MRKLRTLLVTTAAIALTTAAAHAQNINSFSQHVTGTCNAVGVGSNSFPMGNPSPAHVSYGYAKLNMDPTTGGLPKGYSGMFVEAKVNADIVAAAAFDESSTEPTIGFPGFTSSGGVFPSGGIPVGANNNVLFVINCEPNAPYAADVVWDWSSP